MHEAARTLLFVVEVIVTVVDTVDVVVVVEDESQAVASEAQPNWKMVEDAP